MISGQLSRNSGEIKLDGLDVLENDKAMENLCLVREFQTPLKK